MIKIYIKKYIYIKIWSNWANFCEQLWVLRSRFQHPKNVWPFLFHERRALSAPKYEDTTLGGHQIITICFHMLQWYSPGIPWLSSVFHVVSLRETKVFSCQHQTRVLERNLQKVNCPASKPRGSHGNAKTSNHFLFQQETCPLIALPLERVIGMVIKAYSKWISGSYLVHCIIVSYLWVKLATSFLLSSCCSRHLALNLKLLTRRRRRGVSASRQPGWKIRFAAHAGPPQTLQHLKGQQRAILAGSQHFTSKVERLLKDLYEMLKKESGRIWAKAKPQPSAQAWRSNTFFAMAVPSQRGGDLFGTNVCAVHSAHPNKAFNGDCNECSVGINTHFHWKPKWTIIIRGGREYWVIFAVLSPWRHHQNLAYAPSPVWPHPNVCEVLSSSFIQIY